MSAAPPAGTAVCVLGMSRSGTSLTARVLDLAGVHLGPAEELLGEDRRQLAGEGERTMAKALRSNPAGHWEHYRLMRLNERILRSLGGNWREPPPLPPGWQRSPSLDPLRAEATEILAGSFAGRSPWGWKDPRNSLTLPFWRALLGELRCAICLRNPLDVAASLRRRDGIALERGLELWRVYTSAALEATADLPRLLVSYESFFADREGAASRLARFAGRPGAFEDAAARERLAEAVDERLWRNRATLGEAALPAEVAALQARLERLRAEEESLGVG
jgi:hypothetical protein